MCLIGASSTPLSLVQYSYVYPLLGEATEVPNRVTSVTHPETSGTPKTHICLTALVSLRREEPLRFPQNFLH